MSGPLVHIYDWTGPGGGCCGGGTPPPFDYGTWGTPIYHTFTLTNDGSAIAANMADGGTLGGPFSYQGGSYPGTGASCGTGIHFVFESESRKITLGRNSSIARNSASVSRSSTR